MEPENLPLITNDAVVFGLIAGTLALIFYTASGPTPFWRRFYGWVPALLLCYLIPGLYNTFGIIDGNSAGLYPIARDYLLPAALVLLMLSMDLKGLFSLGPKLLIMFVTGTIGVLLGGPIAYLAIKAINPETVSGDAWSGMAALAGSWIGGGANMLAMKEIFGTSADTFGQFIAVDILVGSTWMAFLLALSGRAAQIDARNGADTRAIDEMKERIAAHQAQHARTPTLNDFMVILGLGFALTGLAHAIGQPASAWIGANAPALKSFSLDSTFFWVVMLVTTFGVALSFSPARKLESAGASKLGSMLLYVLVASIGMKMNVAALLDRPWLFALGAIWIGTHGLLLYIVGRAIKAPLFYFAIGSQGNIGAAASAPVVAAAFHPALAPVGVLLGVVGYATGTYLAYGLGLVLRWMAT
ncbi:DUF819 family protein [Dokdonella sp. MW10]|uniref:DUF819 family protein n=1 Tax=Dokdonella sp. MW10 TaxID=2992926 RepID=UPI003F7E71EB